MFSDIHDSSSMLTDLRRLSTASQSSEASFASLSSSSSCSSLSSVGFVAASRLEAALGASNMDDDDQTTAQRIRPSRSLSSLVMEKRLSLYGSAPRLASTLPVDQEAQMPLPTRTVGFVDAAAADDLKAEPGNSILNALVGGGSSVAASVGTSLFASPTMQYLLSGGNPTSLIPASARRSFRSRRVSSRGRNASANFTPMSAGGPLSMTRLLAALVMLCTVGVLVAPIPAGAIPPHTRSYTSSVATSSSYRGRAGHVHPSVGPAPAAYQNHDTIIEADHLIPLHYSAGFLSGDVGAAHAHYQQKQQQQLANKMTPVSSRGKSSLDHAAILAKLAGSSRPGGSESTLRHEHPQHTSEDVLAISRGMAAVVEEEEDGKVAAATTKINDADLSPFAQPPPSLAAADLFDPQGVFSQPFLSPSSRFLQEQQNSSPPSAAAMAAFRMMDGAPAPFQQQQQEGGGDALPGPGFGLGLGAGNLGLMAESSIVVDAGFAGMRGQSFRAHLRSLSK
ncbi:hypothetical protein V8E36_007086 [Tilletia maclaganii]